VQSKLRIILLVLMAGAAAVFAYTQISGLVLDFNQKNLLADAAAPLYKASALPGRQEQTAPTRSPQLLNGLPTLTPRAVTQTTRLPGQLGKPIRAIRLDDTNMTISRNEIAALEKTFLASGINLVSLGAGRAEWTFFKWSGHEAAWSDEVKASGVDYLAENIKAFGQMAYLDASIDVLSPLYIKSHPQAAAISYDGVSSTELVSTVQLAEGTYGRQLLEMIRAVAANYPVDSISINELYYQRDGYGPDDLASYLQFSGRRDWPRTASGGIDINDASIGDWRSAELAKWIDQAQAIAHLYGKAFFVNVALNLDEANSPLLDYGQPLHAIQGKMDKILLWGFFDPENISPQTLNSAAQLLNENDREDKFIFVIGLWNKQNQAISPQKLNQTIRMVQQGGLQDIWITPASLMDAQRWEILRSLWGK
jgi:hypothetical protein